MSDSDGWVKVWRKLLKSQVFCNESLLKVWIWCLLKASHERHWVRMSTGRGETQVEVASGEFVFGRKQAAQELEMAPGSVRNRLAKLAEMGNVDIKPDRHWSIVTILEWATYQDRGAESGQATGQPTDNQRTGNGQPTDTYKTVKKVKKVKKNNGALPPIPLLLDTPEFQVTWTAWQKHRSEIGKKLTPTSVDRLFGKFVQWGVGRAVVAIEHTIAQGWQGIREPEATAGDNGDGHPSRRNQILARLEREAAGKTEETR